MNEKTIVLGLDGIDYDILTKALESRDLPNFERLRNEGSIGVLESIDPPITIPAWQAMFSGKNPGKLGIFHPYRLDKEKGEFVFEDIEKNYGQMIWDTGIETGIGFLPAFSPPYEINGTFIEGCPPSSENPQVFPEERKKDLFTEEDIENLEASPQDKMEEAWLEFEARKNVIHRMLKNYEQELFIGVYKPTDTVAHHRESEEDFYDCYQKIDEELGYFLDYVDGNDANLIVVSDHGADHTEKAFFTNSWLEREGYLKLNKEGKKDESNLLLNIANVFINLGLRKPLEKAHNYIEKFTGKNFKPQKGKVSDQITWNKSEAASYLIGALPTSGIIINEDNVKDVNEKQKEIIEKLEQEEDIKWAKNREEIYNGDNIDKLPHIVVRAKKSIMMKAEIYPDVSIKFDKYGHGYKGLIAGYGRDMSKDEDISGSLLDVAPTVLQSLGKETANDMDGKVIEEIFQEKQEIQEGAPIDGENSRKGKRHEEEEIKDRLEELGYMGG